jgi:hypothetical protein
MTFANRYAVLFPEAGSQEPEALFFLSVVFRDVHDFVLEDEQIWGALPCQADHVPVVVLDPALHSLTIHQLDGDGLLLLTQILQKSCFFKGIFWRRCPPAFGVGIPVRSAERHAGIVHNGRVAPPDRALPVPE